jgi:hypothetical protein
MPLAALTQIRLDERHRATGGKSERRMRYPGFFDPEQRLQVLSAKADPLETIKRTMR